MFYTEIQNDCVMLIKHKARMLIQQGLKLSETYQILSKISNIRLFTQV